MNEDPMVELEVRAGEELERRLARYGRVRLDPSNAQTRRARGAIMEAAWRQRLADPATRTIDPARATGAAGRRRRAMFAAWGPRRIGVSFAAAVMAGLLIGSSAFAATRAGAPLYDARIAFEDLTLPTDPGSRLEARIAQAQARLAEIVDAVSRDDHGALAASVHAYDVTVNDLSESTGLAADRVLAAIESHQAVLLAVRARAPEAALDGLSNAIANSGRVLTKLDAASAAPGTSNGRGTPNGGAGNGNGNGNTGGNAGAGTDEGTSGGPATGGNGNANGAGNGNQDPGGAKPTAQPEPQATVTPKPGRTPRPTLAPEPTRSPKPKPNPGPGQASPTLP